MHFHSTLQVQASPVHSNLEVAHLAHTNNNEWVIVAVPTETKLGSTTFRFGSEHERKMSSIDPATEQSLSCVSRRSVILLMEDSRVIGVFCWRLIFAFCGRALC